MDGHVVAAIGLHPGQSGMFGWRLTISIGNCQIDF